MDDRVPHIDDHLLIYLDHIIPERSPSLGWSMEKIMFEAGKREVVRMLHQKHLEQQEGLPKVL